MHTDSSGASEVPPSSELSAAWAQVAATVTAVEAALGKWLLDNYGVGLTEYRAILHLSRTPDRELRITRLAQKVGLDQSSTTRLVGRMEGKELAYRDSCPDDGRGVYAVITEKGLESVADIREPYERKLRELLSGAAKRYPQLGLADIERSFEVVGGFAS